MGEAKQSRRQAQKQRLWQGVAEAIRQLGWPELVYVCPLCLKSFNEDQRDQLTFEDVPPKAVGGKEMVLTCKDCNDKSGHGLDFHAANFYKIKRLRRGEKVGPFRSTRMTIDDNLMVNVEVESDGHGLVEISGLRIGNREDVLSKFSSILENHVGRSAPTLRLDFPTERWSPWKVQLSYLRAAYLATFACFGYRFAGREALQKVREQINTADRQLIDGFYGWSEGAAGRRVVIVQKPPSIRGVMVLMDEHTVLLPFMDDDREFYSRVRGERDSRDQIAVVGRSFDWPSGPTYLLDHATPAQLRAFRGLIHSVGRNEGIS